MALPMFLAITPGEMAGLESLSGNFAWMACHFSPYTQGITNLPGQLPRGSILMLDDRYPCQGHSANLAAQQLEAAVTRSECDSLLLDFQRPPEPESEAFIRHLVASLPCPVALSEPYAHLGQGPVFLSPCPLHRTLDTHLTPWQGREIWLEAALCQEDLVITADGTAAVPQFPPEGRMGGFFSEELCCRYHIITEPEHITFTLFDTPDSLEKKLKKAHNLGVTRAVGLYQQLRDFPAGKV